MAGRLQRPRVAQPALEAGEMQREGADWGWHSWKIDLWCVCGSVFQLRGAGSYQVEIDLTLPFVFCVFLCIKPAQLDSVGLLSKERSCG